MAETEKVIFTNMCMIYDGSRILVENRTDPHWSGIAFPGGHVEKGESFTDSVIREVYEETGLTISSPRLCGIKSWQQDEGSRYIVLFYKTDKFSGTLHSSEEGEVFWTQLSEIHELPLAEDMADNLRVFLEEDLSEFYYYNENGQSKFALK